MSARRLHYLAKLLYQGGRMQAENKRQAAGSEATAATSGVPTPQAGEPPAAPSDIELVEAILEDGGHAPPDRLAMSTEAEDALFDGEREP